MILYAYEMLIIGNKKEIIKEVKPHWSSKFYAKYLGAGIFILGMEIKTDCVS